MLVKPSTNFAPPFPPFSLKPLTQYTPPPIFTKNFLCFSLGLSPIFPLNTNNLSISPPFPPIFSEFANLENSASARFRYHKAACNSFDVERNSFVVEQCVCYIFDKLQQL